MVISMDKFEEPVILTKEEFIRGINKCSHEDTISKLQAHSARADKFITEAEPMMIALKETLPLMDYVKAEIKRSERRTKMYERLTEQVLGASVLAVFGFVGKWLIAYITIKYFHDLDLK